MTRSAHPTRTAYAALAVAALAVTAFAVPTLIHASRDDATRSLGTPTTPRAIAPVTVASGPPTVPYIADHVLHADGLSVPTTATGVFAAGDTVLVDTYAHASETWQVLREGRLVELPVARPAQVALDDKGAFVAALWWPDKRHARIEAWDPATGRSVGATTIAAQFSECCGGGQPVELYGAHAGAVYFIAPAAGTGTAAWRWTPGDDAPVRLDLPEPLMNVGPLGLVLQGSRGVGKAPAGLVGETNAAGEWMPRRRIGADQGLAASADGSRAAYVPHAMTGGGADLLVDDLTTGTRTTIPLPPLKGYVEPAAFEDDDHVLLDAVDGDRGVLLRCVVSQRICAPVSPARASRTADLPIAGFRG